MSNIKATYTNDLPYITSVYQRIKDVMGTNASQSLIGDITHMIQNKNIKSGGFGFNNVSYTDAPSNCPAWGYVEYFQHADNYVTVILYPDGYSKFWMAQFVLNQTNWASNWIEK